jgi:large subunit ribosomal protein L25
MPAHPLELSAEPRGVFGKHVRRLRRQGIVPANIYGHGDSRAIQAPARALEHLVAHGGRTGVVTIALNGRSETALMKGIQRDPRSGHILHIDFQAVSMEESVTTTVPVRFVGESIAVTKQGGVMTHPRTELHITARAADLPDAIEVDVSTIEELNGSIKVGDLPESPIYKLTDPPDDVLAIVQPPKIEVEEVEVPAEEEAEAAEAAEAVEAAAGEPEPAAEAAPEGESTEAEARPS